MFRRAVLMAAFLMVLAASPASALAAQRYASPSGTGSGCTALAPCGIVTAVNGAHSNDEVILAGNEGTYGTQATPITTGLFATKHPVNIHGAGGQSRPVIYSSASSALELVSGDTASDLAIYKLGSGTAMQSAVRVDHVLVVASAANAIACSLFAGATLTDSMCDAGLYAVIAGSGCSSPCTPTDTLRNDTVVGGTWGIFGDAQGINDTETIQATNTIVSGGSKDVATSTLSGGSVSVNLDHSNYRTIDTSAGGTATPPGSGTNQIAAPAFVNAAAGDFHEAAGSPTIDKGTNSPLNGTTDLDGNPRTLGAATDIGAYEFLPPAPPSPEAPAISKLKLKPSKFRLGKHHKKPKVTYIESKAATVTFSVYKLKHGKRKLVGSFTRSDHAGSNRFRFNGRVKHKKLRPGRYALVATPVANGRTGASVSTKFRVR